MQNTIKTLIAGVIIGALFLILGTLNEILTALDDQNKMTWSLVEAHGMAGSWPEDGTFCLFEDGSIGECYPDAPSN